MNTWKYIANQITRQIYWAAYCIVLFFSIQHFGKLGVNLNDLVVKVLDSQSRSLMVKNISECQKFQPSKHLLVLKTSSRRLQRVFSVIVLRLLRRLEDVLQKLLEDVLKTCLQDVLKTCFEDVLKMSWRHVLKTSWKHYGEKQNTYWWYLYLTNLYLTSLHLTILRRIQNALRRTHHFNICLILELKQRLYSRIKISDDVWCCEISSIKIRHCKKGEAIKTNF